MTDPRDPHCRYPKCECPAGQCQRLDAPFRIDTDSDFATDIGRDKAALIELGRRHPAAADDVDAILAVPPHKTAMREIDKPSMAWGNFHKIVFYGNAWMPSYSYWIVPGTITNEELM